MQFLLQCRYGRWKGRSIGRILCATLVRITHEVCGALLGHVGDEVLGSSGSSVRPAGLQDSSSVEVYVSRSAQLGVDSFRSENGGLPDPPCCMYTSLFWGLQVPFLPFRQEPHTFIDTTLWVCVVSASSYLLLLLSLCLCLCRGLVVVVDFILN